MLTQLA